MLTGHNPEKLVTTHVLIAITSDKAITAIRLISGYMCKEPLLATTRCSPLLSFTGKFGDRNPDPATSK